MSENGKPKLKPAEENPWYVLATIYGESSEVEGDFDAELAAFQNKDDWIRQQNSKVWNAWVLTILSEGQRQRLVKERPRILDDIPEWGSIKCKVLKQFNKRLPGQFPRLSGEIDFGKTYFPKTVWFDGFIFPGKVYFCDAKFQKKVYFKYAMFLSYSYFDSTNFLEEACFSGAYFREANFNRAFFSKRLIFLDSTFIHADFISAHFKNDTLFVRTKLEGESWFSGCHFEKQCNFSEAIFKQEYPSFEGAILQERTTITAKKEFWPDPKNCEQDPEIAKASCADFRHLMNTQGLPEQAHFFFRREMFFASKIGSVWQRFPYLLFGWFSDYGHSLKRPTWALAMLWFFPAMVYWPYLYIGGYTDIFNLEFWNSVARTSVLSSGLSLGNLFQFTGLQRVYLIDIIKGLPWGLKFLGGAQTLLAIPLLFLLLLGLRNRFRLK